MKQLDDRPKDRGNDEAYEQRNDHQLKLGNQADDDKSERSTAKFAMRRPQLGLILEEPGVDSGRHCSLDGSCHRIELNSLTRWGSWPQSLYRHGKHGHNTRSGSGE